MERLLRGERVSVLPTNIARVGVDGEQLGRTSDIYELLRDGVVEVAGPLSWRAKACRHCKSPIAPDFTCCDEPYI